MFKREGGAQWTWAAKNRSSWRRYTQHSWNQGYERRGHRQQMAGYTCVFNDPRRNLQYQSEIILHVPSVNVTLLGIAHFVKTRSSYHWFHHIPFDLME